MSSVRLSFTWSCSFCSFYFFIVIVSRWDQCIFKFVTDIYSPVVIHKFRSSRAEGECKNSNSVNFGIFSGKHPWRGPMLTKFWIKACNFTNLVLQRGFVPKSFSKFQKQLLCKISPNCCFCILLCKRKSTTSPDVLENFPSFIYFH